ncbi:spore gernimation protein GerA [Clostridium carboxidivorans P7]|uniref:GerA spore germination protein n=1 Tax=Clostridium carboxidivorans P7 TaxID=536227 RepID=C6PZ14_9CLOT|nr:spore germination protein [Clostridium carboxidivorans]AKN31409.1 spore gernimation protein GerA [Clostridium carboxidivorans P7]EET85500.1 GerA spore germination protein [Clostridium carboxidivorans P7]EFG87200.1 putative spore germination protein KA [Clostridium carboxidivorans P7]
MIWENKVEELKKNITGMLSRKLNVKDKKIYILYIPQITDRNSLSENVIKPLLQYSDEQTLTAQLIISSIIYTDDVFLEEDTNKITDYVLQGKSVIIVCDSGEYIVANTLKIEKRNIQSPEVEAAVRSPRDAFNENIDSNLSLIRYRIKDSSLKADYCTVGVRTKTSVVLVYLQDVANPKHIIETKKRLAKIKVDGILESGYVQKFLSNKKSTLFSEIGISERSDSACASILEGRICILVDGSNLALIVPKTFIEYLDIGDDHYDNTYLGMFLKGLRFMALIMNLTLSSVYVIIVAFHPEFLPSQYILLLAASRVQVPINAVTEALMMEGILELLREASLRLPKQIGSSVSIVGTIVIGQAAVFAGIVSPLMVIIVSLSSMASYAIADYTFMNSMRLLKFFMIFLSSIFGLFGFCMALTIIVIKIASITSFGIPYTEPIAPFNYEDMKNYISSNVVETEHRPNLLNTKDKRRKK